MTDILMQPYYVRPVVRRAGVGLWQFRCGCTPTRGAIGGDLTWRGVLDRALIHARTNERHAAAVREVAP